MRHVPHHATQQTQSTSKKKRNTVHTFRAPHTHATPTTSPRSRTQPSAHHHHSLITHTLTTLFTIDTRYCSPLVIIPCTHCAPPVAQVYPVPIVLTVHIGSTVHMCTLCSLFTLLACVHCAHCAHCEHCAHLCTLMGTVYRPPEWYSGSVVSCPSRCSHSCTRPLMVPSHRPLPVPHGSPCTLVHICAHCSHWAQCAHCSHCWHCSHCVHLYPLFPLFTLLALFSLFAVFPLCTSVYICWHCSHCAHLFTVFMG